jgi:cyclase
MLFTRVIPVLLIQNDVLVKTARFKSPAYIGDPINAIKIFNEKEVYELVVLDISATKKQKINFDLLSRINKEAFMPLGYGGGVSSLDDAQKIFSLGYEKIVLNHITLSQPEVITKIANVSGNQSVVVCIDIKKNLMGKYYVYDYLHKKNTNLLLVDWAKECEQRGVGEIILHDIEKEGTFTGYNLKMISSISNTVNIPIIALGGAANIDDLKNGIQAGASAVAAGSMFVFHGPLKAVLITYPDKSKMQ